MKKLLLFFIVFFGGLSTVYGQQVTNPVVVISGNDNVYDIGSLIVLKSSVVGAPKSNLVKTSYVWFHMVNNSPVKDFLTIQNDGSEIHSGTGKTAGELIFILIPVFEYTVDTNNIKIVYGEPVKVLVTVGNTPTPTPTPTPSPKPAPTPTPEPKPPVTPASTIPEGVYGITQDITNYIINDQSMSNSEKLMVAVSLNDAFNGMVTEYNTSAIKKSFNVTYAELLNKIKLRLLLMNNSNNSKTYFENYLEYQIYDCYKNKGMTDIVGLMNCINDVNLAMAWVINNVGVNK